MPQAATSLAPSVPEPEPPRPGRQRAERGRRYLGPDKPSKPGTVLPFPSPAAATPTAAPESADQRVRTAVGIGIGAGLLWLILTAQKAYSEMKGEKALMPLVRDAAARANVPPSILAGIVRKESGWSNAPTGESARCGVGCIASSRCAIGVAQVLPATARMSAQQLCEPANSIIAGARYLREMFTAYRAKGHADDRAWYLATMAYNQGPGNVNGWLASGSTSPNNRLPGGGQTVSDKGIAYADKVASYAGSYRSKGIGLAGCCAPPAVGFLTAPARPATMRPNFFRAAHAA
jgi:soluble lytic murein transglycosylase-like protein